MSTKGCWRFFLFRLGLELYAKIKKDLVSTHSQKPGLSMTKDLNKMNIGKYIVKQETSSKFQQKILNFQFFNSSDK